MKKKIFILIAVMMFSCLITFFTRPIQAYTFENSASYSSSLSDFKNFEKELMSELNKSIIDVESINYDRDSYDSDSYSLEEVEFLYYLCVIDLHLIHCAVSIRYALAA